MKNFSLTFLLCFSLVLQGADNPATIQQYADSLTAQVTSNISNIDTYINAMNNSLNNAEIAICGIGMDDAPNAATGAPLLIDSGSGNYTNCNGGGFKDYISWSGPITQAANQISAANKGGVSDGYVKGLQYCYGIITGTTKTYPFNLYSDQARLSGYITNAGASLQNVASSLALGYPAITKTPITAQDYMQAILDAVNDLVLSPSVSGAGDQISALINNLSNQPQSIVSDYSNALNAYNTCYKNNYPNGVVNQYFKFLPNCATLLPSTVSDLQNYLSTSSDVCSVAFEKYTLGDTCSTCDMTNVCSCNANSCVWNPPAGSDKILLLNYLCSADPCAKQLSTYLSNNTSKCNGPLPSCLTQATQGACATELQNYLTASQSIFSITKDLFELLFSIAPNANATFSINPMPSNNINCILPGSCVFDTNGNCTYNIPQINIGGTDCISNANCKDTLDSYINAYLTNANSVKNISTIAQAAINRSISRIKAMANQIQLINAGISTTNNLINTVTTLCQQDLAYYKEIIAAEQTLSLLLSIAIGYLLAVPSLMLVGAFAGPVVALLANLVLMVPTISNLTFGAWSNLLAQDIAVGAIEGRWADCSENSYGNIHCKPSGSVSTSAKKQIKSK
jgi:hypothetical protein